MTALSQLAVNRIAAATGSRVGIDGLAMRGPVYDITHPTYGAVPGQDSTNAILAALTDLRAVGGGSLYVPVGTFIFDPDVALFNLTSQLSMFGDGAGRSILQRKAGAVSTDLFFMGDPANVTLHTDIAIAGLTFDGNRASTAPAGAGVVCALSKVQRLYMHGIELRNGPFFGFSAKFLEDARITNILSRGHNRDGFSFGEGCKRIAIGVVVSRETGDDGMAFNGSAAGVVEDVTVASYTSYRSGMNTDGSGGGGSGLKISGGCRRINIAAMHVRESADASLSIIPASDSAVFPTDYPSEIEVTGFRSYLAGQRAGSPTKNGIRISAGTQIAVSGTIRSSVGDGVSMLSASGTALAQEISLDLRVRDAGGYGIAATGALGRMSNVEIRGRIRRSGASGLSMIGIDGLTLGCSSLDNNQLGNVGDGDSAGLSISDCTKVVMGPGRYSDDQGVHTQRFGCRFYGAVAVTDLTMTGVKSVGNVAGQIGFVVNPVDPVMIVACTGLVQDGKDVVGRHNATLELDGAGSPAGVVNAPPGSRYWNVSGGAATTLYVKESGTGTAGWVAK